MEAMLESSMRLKHMVHDAGLWPSTEERLQKVLEAARIKGILDASFISWFDEAVVSFLERFNILVKLADGIAIRLKPTHPGSTLPANLHGDNLLHAPVTLQLPIVTAENVHLEVALAAQRLAHQYTIDLITHVYEQVIHEDQYVPEDDARTLAFFDRRETLDDIVEKHVNLATGAATPQPPVDEPVH